MNFRHLLQPNTVLLIWSFIPIAAIILIAIFIVRYLSGESKEAIQNNFEEKYPL